MALVIRVSVDLSTIGAQYEGVSFTFKSIAAQDVGVLMDELDKLSDNFSEHVKYMLKVCEDQFIDGKQGKEELTKEDVKSLDTDGLIYCFKILTGQNIDPKVESGSTTPSTTEVDTPQN